MKRKIFVIVMIAIVMTATAVCAADQPKQTWSAKASAQDYRIYSGDILEIVTWKEPDFSREETMQNYGLDAELLDGKISFPLLNDVQASGLTTGELKANIEAGLKDYVSHPVVTVSVRNPLSQRIYILGEVKNTGEYPLVKHLTVLQAFALAGGFTEWASKDEIILMRNENGTDKVYRINYKAIAKGRDLSQNIKIQADDTIIVP